MFRIFTAIIPGVGPIGDAEEIVNALFRRVWQTYYEKQELFLIRAFEQTFGEGTWDAFCQGDFAPNGVTHSCCDITADGARWYQAGGLYLMVVSDPKISIEGKVEFHGCTFKEPRLSVN